MKKNKITYYLSLIAMVTLFSCNNDDNPSVDSNNTFLPVSFKVGFSGQTLTADEAQAVISNGEISINAIKGTNNESFSFAIAGNSVGTYPTNESVILYSTGVNQQIYSSINPADALTNTGQIKITSINTVNKRISGSFDYTGYYRDGLITYTKEFTNGTFKNIPYTIGIQ
ncbi:DUF6252 family protein [Flavobacterium luteum]|uniref:Uncharacterized protein n=1 Tax=Flavobacterium luteum TaxID=2026654 RepID=A0A7J5AJ96_9FLAO|nr:DUF6252 family protein [Flavobacterium luteum]KAB1157691.1 hypothetical protein F6464_01000 [Flavobacterium luteum]